VKADFSRIYDESLWGGGGSGPGSRGAEAEEYAELVNGLAQKRGWQSATDAGSGDGTVAGMLKFKSYCGVDVVDSVSAACRTAFAEDKSKTFMAADFFADREILPAADVLLCRDVLHHWPTRHVADWVSWVKAEITAGRWKAAVLSFDESPTNRAGECPIGGYRPLPVGPYPLSRLRVSYRLRRKAVVIL